MNPDTGKFHPVDGHGRMMEDVPEAGLLAGDAVPETWVPWSFGEEVEVTKPDGTKVRMRGPAGAASDGTEGGISCIPGTQDGGSVMTAREQCLEIFRLARRPNADCQINNLGGGVCEVMLGQTMLARRIDSMDVARVTESGVVYLKSVAEKELL